MSVVFHGAHVQKMPCVSRAAVDLESKVAQIEVEAECSIIASAVVPSLVQAVSDLGCEAKAVS
jgi:hypothetical protein